MGGLRHRSPPSLECNTKISWRPHHSWVIRPPNSHALPRPTHPQKCRPTVSKLLLSIPSKITLRSNRMMNRKTLLLREWSQLRKNLCLGIRWQFLCVFFFAKQLLIYTASFKKSARTWIFLLPPSTNCGRSKRKLHRSKHQNNQAGKRLIQNLITCPSKHSAKLFVAITVHQEF